MAAQTVGLFVNGLGFKPGESPPILADALIRRGHACLLLVIDSLSMENGRVLCRAARLTAGWRPDEAETAWVDIEELDWLWPLGYGPARTFLDYAQLLWLVERRGEVKFVNSVNAMVFLGNKNAVPFVIGDPAHFPDTLSTKDRDFLESRVREGRDYVLKPPGGSMGRGVFRLNRADPNYTPLVETAMGEDSPRYVVRQEFLPHIAAQGEKRVLLAAGEIVLSYRKASGGNGDFRGNLARGATAGPAMLSPEEAALCRKVAAAYGGYGVRYLGIDLAFPHVIEVNTLNPGGLHTYAALTGTDKSTEVIELLFS